MTLAGLSVACALPLLLPLFDGQGRLALILAALLPGAAMALAPLVAPSARLTVQLTRVGLVVAAGMILLATLPGGALTGLADGVARLLTASLPTTAAGPAFGAAVACTYIASAIGVGLAGSGRVAVGCALPAAALMVGALLVGAGGPNQPHYPAALLVVACGLGTLIQQLGPAGWASGPAAIRRFGVGLIVAVVVAVLAVPLAGILPGDHARAPYELRAAVAPPPKAVQQVGLLDTYSAVYDGPEQTVFTARVTGANPLALYWQLATYDQFNGFEWTSSAVYQRAGTGLPPGPHLRVATQTVRAVLAPSSLPGYVPAPGRAVSVSVSGLGVAASDGELLIPAQLKVPAQLTVTSALANPSSVQLVNAQVPSGPTEVGAGPIPPSLEALATRVAASAPPYPFARLTALSDYLTAAPFVAHPPGDSPIGAGYYQVTQLLQTHDGSSEQYAAAFAVLARAMGFQARLAIGYTDGTLDPSTNTLTVTTRDLRVWPEVELSGLGWVALPSTPDRTVANQAVAAPLPSPLAQALQSQRQIDAAAAGKNHATGPAGQTPPPLVRHTGRSLAWWAWLIIALAAAEVAGVGALLAAKAARRRRQRTGRDAPARVAGAWEHTVDRLVEFGLSIPVSLTAPEVVAQAEAAFGADTAGAMLVLSPVVDAARYDRSHPPDDATAERVWGAATEVGSSLRAQATLAVRVRAALSPAPFVRRREGPLVALPRPGRGRGGS
jgi:transglutaminase-like putative cysteine protease